MKYLIKYQEEFTDTNSRKVAFWNVLLDIANDYRYKLDLFTIRVESLKLIFINM